MRRPGGRPRRTLEYRGTTFEEMDLDEVLARHPRIALVDELAHTNVPGSRNDKRWQDIDGLLDAGIDVISTVNLQHLESLNDVVEKITGVPQKETVPDSVVRAADQVELVDMSAESLRRRMAHGNTTRPTRSMRRCRTTPGRQPHGAARLALLGSRTRSTRGCSGTAASTASRTPGRPASGVVALTGGPEGDTLLRRGARIAARAHGGDLLALHVARSDGLTGASPASRPASAGSWSPSGPVPRGGRRRHRGGDARVRPRRERDAARGGGEPALAAEPAARWLRGRLDRDPRVRRHRRARRDPAAVGHGVGLPRLGGGLTARRRIEGALLALVALPLVTALLAQTAAA